MSAVVQHGDGDREQRIRQRGEALLAAMEREAHGRQQGRGAGERWLDALMQRLADNEGFRVQALRFVDVLPTLQDDADLVRHLKDYFGDQALPFPGLTRWGLRHAGMAAPAVAAAVRAAMHTLASRFVGGSDAPGALETLARLRERGLAFTLDLLGEATVSEAEADRYQSRYLSLMDALAAGVAGFAPHPLLDRAPERPLPRVNLSIKVSSLYSQADVVDLDGGVAAIAARLRPILHAARERGAAVCLDMEHYDHKPLVLAVLKHLLMEDELRDWPDAAIAVQAYLRKAEDDLTDLAAWAQARGTPVGVRLVRGAYWDHETVVARRNGWPVPVWEDKGATDACFERCLALLFHRYPALVPAVATHNPRSLALALTLAEVHGLPPGAFELQMLYGMGEDLAAAVADQGQRVRIYVPFGELLPGMAYLVRRLLENSTSQSFQRLMLGAGPDPSQVLAPPSPATPPPEAPTGFRNQPPLRFVAAAERQAFAGALEQVRRELGRHYPLVIDGRHQDTEQRIVSVNPADPDEVVGTSASAGREEADRALAGARAALPAWRATPVGERAALLRRAAQNLRERRYELAAWEVLESGKGWREADAHVCEAVDFLTWYAREAERLLAAPAAWDVPGEENRHLYRPRGVGVIIPPWNFPLAILTGMLSAAVVTGNTAILKPSSQTPVIAARLVELLEECGLPDGVVQYLPGPGAQVGEHLVAHPEVHFVAFTGSLAVGSRILELAARIPPGQHHVKRVIAEMGGKNAIVVDADADLDDAVSGVVASAFGYQGQKCSACSRAIVVDAAYEPFLERLVEAARSLPMGPPQDPHNAVGPVIEDAARARIARTAEEAKGYARCMLERSTGDLPGFYVGPTVFADVPPDSPLAQQEVFGPVLAVLRARDFEHALAIANHVPYALTGGVYSRSPAHLERAREAFEVGNLYLNRRITGALVGRQPFGGFRLSGMGSKAGGPDYLLQFLEPRVVTENTFRRGFAPRVEG